MTSERNGRLRPQTDDPIQFLETAGRSTIVTEWRWMGTEHGIYRIGELSVLTGKARSRLNFDHRWDCHECHPYKAWAEGNRIVEAFEGLELWVSVVEVEGRSGIRRKADRDGLRYVALPAVTGLSLIVLTDAPLFEAGRGSQLAGDSEPANETFVRDVVMPLRWTGSISATREFLPPARKYRYFETHHRDTGRRCWHLHDTIEGASACRDEIGQQLDGSRKGWYVRGCSEWRIVGRIGVSGLELEQLLIREGIPPLSRPMVDRRVGADRRYVEFGPISWDDTRFVRLREQAKWTTSAQLVPPPMLITVRFDVLSGNVTAAG